MTKKKKILATAVVSVIVFYMLRTTLAKSLTNTSFGTLSDKLFNFIGGLEKFTPVAEWDFKQWSVGYGSGFNWDQNRPVQKGDVIDKATAKKWLLIEAQKNFDQVMQMVKVNINDNQLVALSSFAYNEGNGALQNSTLLKLLNSGADKNTVAAQFDQWVYAGGKVSNGLKNRRAAEKKLFLS
jgi:GH24 family phage-related lysozyme (muramidase)